MKAESIIPAQSGTAFLLKHNQLLKITDIEGEQVCDLFCFSQENRSDGLSSGRSIDYNETVYFTKGHKLYSNSGKIMFTILEDTCGRNDFLVTPCSLQMFQMISGKSDYHPSCHENLTKALAPYEIHEGQILTTLNIFMNVPVSEDGKIRVLPPLSKSGDYILLRAEIDLIVGLTACSDEGTNNGRFKPIKYEIQNGDL